MTIKFKRIFYLLILFVLLFFCWFSFLKLNKKSTPSKISITNSKIAINNLESQVSSAKELLLKFPNRFALRVSLFNLLKLRIKFLGTFNDFEYLESITNYFPKTADEYMLKAQYFTLIHDFKQAKTLLNEALKLEPKNKDIERKLFVIDLATNKNLENLKLFNSFLLNSKSTPSNSMLLASIETEFGNFKKADQYYQDAINKYNDSSPFLLAYILFNRGLMWSEKVGNKSLGKKYYLEAVQYLPEYVVAQVHLAEFDLNEGNTKIAISRLSNLLFFDDPEIDSTLAELYTFLEEKEKVKQYVSSALKKYNLLLSRYPLAFVDHGSEFFMGLGSDPKRAMELAQFNLNNRQNERSYIVAIHAAINLGDNEKLCMIVSSALEIKPVLPVLLDIIKDSNCPTKN